MESIHARDKAPDGMKWFRTHIRNGSRLALLALAIQLVLSFGHVHPARAQAPAGSAIESLHLPADQLPASDQHPADHCDICAVLSMAGTMLAASPPALPPPPATDFRLLDAREQFVDRAASGVAFQPRGPPLA